MAFPAPVVYDRRMSGPDTSVMERIHALVDQYRTTCLWYLRVDYYPETADEAVRVLGAIARHGDAEAFRKASELRTWLSHPSNSPSAV